jgi:Zn-dependent protease
MTRELLAIAFASLVVHEFAHAWVAFRLGDTTARDAGRLTLNPLAHIDLVLTLALPAVTLIASHGTMALGGGKPVPVNRMRLRNGWRGYLMVVLAGPAANLTLALAAWAVGLEQFALVNAALAVFNLLPLPGFDGWNAARACTRLRRDGRRYA